MAFRNLFPKKVTTGSRENDNGGYQQQQQHQIRSPRLPFSFPVKNPFSKSFPGSEASESGSTGSGSGGGSGGGDGGGGGGFLKKKGGRHRPNSSVDENAATVAVAAAAGNGVGGGVGDGGTTEALETHNRVSPQPAVATARAAASSAAGGGKLGGLPATAADSSAATRQTDAATPADPVMSRSKSDNPKAEGRDNGAMARSSSDAGETGKPTEASAAEAGGGAGGVAQTAAAAAAAAAVASPAPASKAPPKLMLFDIHEPVPSSLMAPPPSSGRTPASQPAEGPSDSTPGSSGGGRGSRHRSLGGSSSFSNSPGGSAREGGAAAAATPGGSATSAKPKAKLRKFKEKELRAATEGFAAGRELGEGSFGKVYRGMITMAGEPGVVQTVAVKVLNEESSQGMDEMLNEVLVAKGTTHPNLIRLLGYSIDTRDAMLVYEFCPNGSVESRLQPGEDPRPKDFPWEHRLRAMLQTAQALNCLHENNIIHRDLKLANLLLDEKDDVKLSDFGMAKELGNGKTHISTRIMGTMGYLDPNYVESGKLREKSDVFSFGVIMLELLSGRKAMDPEEGFLFSALQPVLQKRPIDLNALLDPGLEGKYNKSAATKVAKVAKMCTSEQLDSRPELRYVIADLESALSITMGGSSRK